MRIMCDCAMGDAATSADGVELPATVPRPAVHAVTAKVAPADAVPHWTLSQAGDDWALTPLSRNATASNAVLTSDAPSPPMTSTPKTIRTIEGTDVPLLVFVNALSGGGKGKMLHSHFVAWLGAEQVCDLAAIKRGGPKPEQVLARYVNVARCRVLVCGGDGTCSWLLAAIDRVCAEAGRPAASTLPTAVMPLGTGNDLARALGWGKGFTRSMARREWLRKVSAASVAPFDRWSVALDACEGLPPHFQPDGDSGEDGGEPPRRRGMICNYMGVGIEAAALHAFHTAREAVRSARALPAGSGTRARVRRGAR